jgi:pyruvate ferredoxin oxidoreductase gamma subunit
LTLDVRIHGRGGQGVVTAAELLSLAAFDQGLHAQALPSFGSERTGAPVVSFCRIDEQPIRSHDPVDHPDLVVLQDPTLLHAGGVLDGLADDGVVVVNSSRTPAELADAGLRLRPGQRVVTVPATELSRELLGRPLPNTALLGAVAGVTGVVSLDAVRGAIRQRFGSRPEGVVAANLRLAEAAHALVTREVPREEEQRHAQAD